MKKIIALLILFTITTAGSCEPDPFKYETNSRIIIEGTLQNEAGLKIANQSIKLLSVSGSKSILIMEVFSDLNGNFFLSSAKGNNNLHLEFTDKAISNSTNNAGLIHINGYSDWIGFLPDSYYDFGNITLKNY